MVYLYRLQPVMRRVNTVQQSLRCRERVTGHLYGIIWLWHFYVCQRSRGPYALWSHLERTLCIVYYKTFFSAGSAVVRAERSPTGWLVVMVGGGRVGGVRMRENHAGRVREGEAAKIKIRNGKNCCLRLEQFKNETWTRGTWEGVFLSGNLEKQDLLPPPLYPSGIYI